ncbi:MAG TPA: DUF4384 domain-containing protein [Caldimonas sp.]|nr:DUF4384 domain-containing protein [Caldimonas sp.]
MIRRSLHGLASAVLLAAFASAAAQEVRLLENAELRGHASPAAPVVASWRAGHRAQLVELRAGWAQVRDGSTTAWLRASALDTAPAGYAAAAALETGRRASGNEVVSLGVRSYPAPRPNRHALIIGVGAYQTDPARKVEALPGVKHDLLNALVIARYLQVPIENTTLVQDEAATRTGLATAMADLATRMNPGDRVFIYWAGHGSRYRDAAEGGACIESLVPFDLKDVSNRDFATWVKPIGDKADKMLVMFDACHSAGVADASRSIAVLRPRATAGADACQVPSNVRTRSFSTAVREAGLSVLDVVHVASARPDEVSFEDATGGLATTALRDCLGGDAVDRDGSGAVTMAEIAACVQAKVDSKMAPYPRLASSHLTLSGNASFVPALFAAPVAAGPTIAAPVPVVGIDGVVQEIYRQRDAKWTVRASASGSRVKIGDLLPDWSVTSDRDGYLYVVMVGSDRQSLYLLFPNDLDQDHRIAAQRTVTIPRPQWALRAGGPVGNDEILVIVTDGPRDLSVLEGTKTVSFTKPLTDAAGRARLQRVFATNAHVGAACTSASGCSDAFGAAVLTIQEHD